jgi:co-chaperonin GroES (HSP10)
MVVAEENKPKPTMAVVLKVGDDPLARELYKEGDIVMFSKYAGNTFSESGEQYRSLELHEIIGSRDPADGLEDLQPPRNRDAHLGHVGSE